MEHDGDARLAPVLQFSVPCLGVDEQQGPPCFMYVFYELPLAEYPYRFPEASGFFVVNGWSRGQGDFTQRLRILGPEREVLLDTGARPFTLESPRTPFMTVNFVQGFEFPRPGAYSIEVFLDESVVLDYPVHATLAGGGGWE